MTCRIIAFMVPDGPPFYANGSCHAVYKCETHNWTTDYGHPHVAVGAGTEGELCPIGRIEQARDEAIARIKAERA